MRCVYRRRSKQPPELITGKENRYSAESGAVIEKTGSVRVLLPVFFLSDGRIRMDSCLSGIRRHCLDLKNKDIILNAEHCYNGNTCIEAFGKIKTGSQHECCKC